MSQIDLSPNEAANHYSGDSANRQEWLFEHPPEDLIEFIRLKQGRSDAVDIQYLFAMLNFRIAEEAAKSANKLHVETSRLVIQVTLLTGISEGQLKLAARLENQTNSIICLTWGLLFLTVALLVVEILIH